MRPSTLSLSKIYLVLSLSTSMKPELIPFAEYFNKYFSKQELAETGFFHPEERSEKTLYVENPYCLLDFDTLRKLNLAREIAGIPFVLTCSYRSSWYDKTKGRSGEGAHTLGRAYDIRCTSDSHRFKIVSAALQAGFNRIGIAKTFIHLDDSPKHKQNVVWLYNY